MESSYQKFGKDVVVIGILDLLSRLSGLIILPLITKTLGVHDYGLYVLVGTTASMFAAFIDMGLSSAVVRFLAAKTSKEEIQEEFYSVFFVNFFISLLTSLLIIIFADFIAQAFFGGATQIVRIVGLINLASSLIWVFTNYFKTFRQMIRVAIFSLANTYGKIGVIAYLVLNGYGIVSVVLALLVIQGTLLFILFYSVRAQIGVKWPHFSKIREYLKFGIPLVPGGVSLWVVNLSDRYVIGYFLGVTSVGIYSASYGIANFTLMAAGALVFVLPPALSKLYDQGRLNEVETLLSYSLKYFLALAIPFLFGATILAEPVLRLLSTAEIASQGRLIVPIVALSIALYSMYHIISPIILLAKKTKIIAVTWAIAALLNLALNILIVPRIGILGAAITTFIAFSLALGIVTYYSIKVVRLNIMWNFVLKSLVASVVMSLVIWQIDSATTLNVIITVVTGGVVYAIVLLLLKGFRKDEWRFVKGLFQRS